MRAREISDEQLLHHLAAYLQYEARGGGMCFADWAEAQKFMPSDRAFLEAFYVGATVLPRLGA